MAPVESKRPILLITNDLGPHLGGIETFLLGLLGELKGEEIIIYTSKQSGSEDFDLVLAKKMGVKILRDRAKILLPTPRVVRNIRGVIKEFNCEIAWFGAAAPLALMAQKLKKYGINRTIAITHGHEVWWAKLPFFRRAMRSIGNGCDVVTYLGAFTRDAIKGALGERPQLVQIAPGIALDFFTPGPKPVDLVERYRLKSAPTILCVGRLVKRKGQDKLIKALPEIKDEFPNVKLLLVGEGPLRKKLSKLVKKLQLEDNVIFTGRVSYEELPKYFRVGDIFAMPARTRNFGLEVEGLGIVYLEASATGLPVIVGSSGGAPDALIQGETGYVVDGRNVEEIARQISYLIRDPESAKRLGEKGRDWIESNWPWQLWGEKFSEVLRG
mgnify:FL=1